MLQSAIWITTVGLRNLQHQKISRNYLNIPRQCQRCWCYTKPCIYMFLLFRLLLLLQRKIMRNSILRINTFPLLVVFEVSCSFLLKMGDDILAINLTNPICKIISKYPTPEGYPSSRGCGDCWVGCLQVIPSEVHNKEVAELKDGGDPPLELVTTCTQLH